MSAVQALAAARAAGVRVRIDGDGLIVKAAPANVLDLLKQHKAEIIAMLRAGRDEAAHDPPAAVAAVAAVAPAAPVADYRAALAEFEKHRPHGFTRFRHDQACWAGEMFLHEWGATARRIWLAG
jgi:hypothetical protein